MAEAIIELSGALDMATIAHAFGGALALAWCTERARGTIDIDVNVFLSVDQLDTLVAALPAGLVVDEEHRHLLLTHGQARLWWGRIPVDIFLNTTDFHRQAALRTHRESFGGADVPFLGCTDLAVFKAFFNRTKDWADLEAMAAARTLDIDRLVGVIARYLGPDDERIPRLLGITSQS